MKKHLITDYLRAQKAMLKGNRGEIERENRKMLTLIQYIMLILFLALLIVSFTVPSYYAYRNAYIVFLSVNVLLLLFSAKKDSGVSVTVMLYLEYVVTLAYTIFSSSFISSGYVSVMILALIFELPLLILDGSVRIDGFVLAASALYLAIAVPNKVAVLKIDEMVNVAAFNVIALPVGELTRKCRLENLELRKQSQIREITDALTGIHNRRKLFRDITRRESSGSVDRISALLMIDVDCFKLYNDTYGHQAGDDCLERIGDCLLRLERESGVSFYRYGGEEFVALADDISPNEAAELCRTVNERVAAMRIPHERLSGGRVTVSIGYVTAGARAKPSYETMISQADSALYVAKRRGRGRAERYVEGDPEFANVIAPSYRCRK